MALTQSYMFDGVGNLVDTRTVTSGWHGMHSLHREAPMFEAFGDAGPVTIGAAAVAKPSASPIPFKVIARDAAGVETPVATGTFPANAYQADAASLNLSAAGFVNPLPATSYAVIPSGTLVESTKFPGVYQWSEAPTDGSGFTLQLILTLQ